MTPVDTIKRIAAVAEVFAAQAGVGGMEIAGMIVSVLAEHPEQTQLFLEDPMRFMIHEDLMAAQHGRLTFHNTKGEVTTPQELLVSREARRMERGRA